MLDLIYQLFVQLLLACSGMLAYKSINYLLVLTNGKWVMYIWFNARSIILNSGFFPCLLSLNLHWYELLGHIEGVGVGFLLILFSIRLQYILPSIAGRLPPKRTLVIFIIVISIRLPCILPSIAGSLPPKRTLVILIIVILH